MPFTLPPLPYDKSALAPFISEQTLEYHYGKHHKGYVDKLNSLLENLPLAKASPLEVIVETAGQDDQKAIFNNAAQVWNHDFYWKSMKPGGGGGPQGALLEALNNDLGGYEGFRETFAKAGAEGFGSGYAWLVVKDGALAVVSTPNAELPLIGDAVPLMTMDVWEHAYYLDRQNRRADYISAYLDNLVNWEFAQSNFDQA